MTDSPHPPERRWPAVALILAVVIGIGIMVALLILLLVAVGALGDVQSYDHAQTARQLQQAAAGAKIIPQAIATLERHLDKTIRHEIAHAVKVVLKRYGHR